MSSMAGSGSSSCRQDGQEAPVEADVAKDEEPLEVLPATPTTLKARILAWASKFLEEREETHFKNMTGKTRKEAEADYNKQMEDSRRPKEERSKEPMGYWKTWDYSNPVYNIDHHPICKHKSRKLSELGAVPPAQPAPEVHKEGVWLQIESDSGKYVFHQTQEPGGHVSCTKMTVETAEHKLVYPLHVRVTAEDRE